MTLDRPFEKLDRLQAKTMELYSTLTKTARKNPPTLASRYVASPNVLKEVPSSSPEHEVQVIPPVGKELEAQTTEECQISIIPVETKETQIENQMEESINCPIPSVPTIVKDKMQDNSEGTQSKTATEKSNTSQNKEEKTYGKIGTTSETTEVKSEEIKPSDRRKPGKKKGENKRRRR